ncbi:hypothetical protein SAMN04488544_0381 [Microlunatus sagamiharensis]|uniref:Stress-response A/B barrel domain-containing protein n=1 Tax=Microlunatus sagamiharensis TaxID=546874 RepID=A0A1H2LL53_9ACTN|nr:hypothetical protein [Microlunatus sagamiharensis]SDU81378.1 hypothetical protein SAMN04488544_0381 [Microlunatus sagamiharensis]
MIRNVVLGRIDPNATEEVRFGLDAGLLGLAGMRPAGLVGPMRIGFDAGLREGGWSFAITNDWVDAAAYQAYDTDREHGEFRALIGAACSELARVQFETPDVPPDDHDPALPTDPEPLGL